MATVRTSERRDERGASTTAIAQTKQGADDAAERGVGRRVAGHAKDYLAEGMRTRRKKSSGDFEMLAKSLRLMSQQLEGNMASPWVGKLAGGLERAADSLSRAELRDVTRAAGDFARREPLLFYTGMFAIGLGGARFFKCTARDTAGGQDKRSQKKQGTAS